MENELRRLLTARGDELSSALGLRGASERKDALNSLLRSVLRDSSLRYVDESLSRYDGRIYVRIGIAEVRDAVLNVLSDMGVGASDLGRMGDTAYSELSRKRCPSMFWIVAFRNCLYHVDDGKAFGFDPRCVPGIGLPYDYDPQAGCPMWERFLFEVLPDEGTRMNLQEFFGMCLSNRTCMSIEKMALMVGSGANGKSVVCDVARAVLGGKELVGNLSPDQLQNEKQIAGLEGKILNIAPDVRRGAAFDSALKALASSQEVTGWRLYSGGVTIKCPPLCFALNEMPYFRDTTEAFFRRLLVFRFDVVIPEERQDRTLASRIVAQESCGVFLWMMEGRRRLLANQGLFTRSAVMEASLAGLKDDVKTGQSPVLQYIYGLGYSISPCEEGQTPEKVSASAIVEGLGGGMTKYAVTRELRRAGVAVSRGFYYLYKTI